MTALLIVRHGQSTWNADGRVQGWADPPLSALGREQARAAAGWLESFDGAVVCSPLIRAHETARIIASIRGLGEPATDLDLREVDVGDWTGLTKSEIERGWPAEAALWRERKLPAYPGGETRAEHYQRVLRGLRRQVRGRGGFTLLVVCHGGVLGSIERALDCYTGEGYAPLTGRWFELTATGLLPGERVDLVGERVR